MRVEYKMTEEELDDLRSIMANDQFTPDVKIRLSMLAWQDMADKYGFKWRTAGKAKGKSKLFFKAEPK